MSPSLPKRRRRAGAVGLCAAWAAIGLASPPVAAEPLAEPFLINANFGFGIEPHNRQPVRCSHSTTDPNGVTRTTQDPQCNMVLAFGVGAEALWRGFVGASVGLFAAEGSPVIVENGAAFGDRISVALAASLRPLAPLSWRHGSGWGWRLLAGIGVQAGVALEMSRTSLDQLLSAGFHGELFLDVPLYGANTVPGLALRLSGRLIVTKEAQLAYDSNKAAYQVDEPGTAVQLFAGIAYYL